MDIEAIRKAMRAANVTGSGDYITSGKHYLELVRAKFQTTMIESKAKQSMIFEFKVHATTAPDKMPIESTRSYVDNPDNTGYLGRVKACLFALLGVDPNGKITEAQETSIVDVYGALVFESERVRLGLPDNFLAGRFVVCEGFDDTSRTNKKPIVKKNWYPAPPPAAAPAT